MEMDNNKTLIFTDLDGTLLDHETYDWTPAQEALALAKSRNIPVIMCTSKTLSECIQLQKTLQIEGPVIFENGAGAALPKAQFDRPSNLQIELSHHWVCGFCSDYATIREKLKQIKRFGRYVFKGFGDMTDKEIAGLTDLPLERAAQAKKRLFTEPLSWMDSAKNFNAFHKDIEEAGLSLTRGGRFVHVLEECDKGKTMAWMTKRYFPIDTHLVRTIALGDSPNDIPMLEAASVAVIVKNPHRPTMDYPYVPKQTVVRTQEPGPEGWNAAILSLLSKELVHG